MTVKQGRPGFAARQWQSAVQRGIDTVSEYTEVAAQKLAAAADPRARLLRKRRWALRLGLFFTVASVFWVGVTAVLASWSTPVWALLITVGFLILGPRVFKLIWDVRAPGLLAFATASSEAAYPRLLEQLERHGVANRVVSFVLPLGYSFNLDGSMMYCTFAVMFIAQAVGIPLSWDQQVGMLLLLMITSKGIAGVPRASLVVISATLPAMGMKPEWIALVLAVDAFMDMGRTATNVIGNSIACAVIAKWEGLLGNPGDDMPVVETILGPGEDGAASSENR